MKNKTFLLILLCSLLISCGVRDENKKAGVFISESSDPKPTSPSQDWGNQEPGLNASWASTNFRFRKNYIPKDNLIKEFTINGWGNERINAQMVIWSPDTIMDISIEASDLFNGNNKITSENIKHYFVRNVISDQFLTTEKGPRENNPEYASLFPDAFEVLEAYNHPGQTSRSVWFTIQVPSGTIPGTYSGKVSLKNNKGIIKEMPLQLSISNYSLPDSKDWAFHLDLWQNPYAVARTESVEVWSPEHFDAMKPLYERLADAGQKCITATITPKAWGGQTLDPFGSMVKRVLLEDGSWEFDYQIFDQWVDFMIGLGIDKEINCYSMIPWGENYYFYDKANAKEVLVNLPTGSKEYESYWAPFLRDFHNHLSSKGILNITSIACDERPSELMQTLIEIINKYAPGLKLSIAANQMYLSDIIHDLCIYIPYLPEDPTGIQNRKDKGMITTFYTCCVPEFPNTFTFSPPSESTWMGWFAYANNLDGYLRWAYNSWSEDPLNDTRFRQWSSGDCFLVYPGNRSSIRFEKLRDGIEDYEKIRIIRKELTNSSDPASVGKLELLDEHLSHFKHYPPVASEIPENIDKAQKFINSLLK